jgi:hypothetical protein
MDANGYPISRLDYDSDIQKEWIGIAQMAIKISTYVTITHSKYAQLFNVGNNVGERPYSDAKRLVEKFKMHYQNSDWDWNPIVTWVEDHSYVFSLVVIQSLCLTVIIAESTKNCRSLL